MVTMLASGAGHNPARPGKKAEPGADFFSEPAIRTFRFEVSEAALNQLRQSPRSYVTGRVIEGGHTLTNVAFRLRGHGSFRSLEEKPNLAVNFHEFGPQNSTGLLESRSAGGRLPGDCLRKLPAPMDRAGANQL